MHNTLIAYKNSAFNISNAEFKTNMMKSYERTETNETDETEQHNFLNFIINILFSIWKMDTFSTQENITSKKN